MTRRISVPPPPTRFAPRTIGQLKPPALAARSSVPPPPTRFAPGSAGQPKPASVWARPAVPPPPTRYGTAPVSQPKPAASAPRPPAPPPPLARPRVVQAMEKQEDDGYFTDEETFDSGYDSDVEHPSVWSQETELNIKGVELDGQPVRLMTVEQFEVLPNWGLIDPFRLRTAQGGIELHFRDEKRTIYDTMYQLIEDPDYALNIPPVEIGVYDGRVWVFDTRRVVSAQMARKENPKVRIQYVKIDEDKLKLRVASILTLRRWQGVVTSVRYEGTNSGSFPHVNPVYEPQLFDQLNWEYGSYHGGHRSYAKQKEVKTKDDDTGEKKPKRWQLKQQQESDKEKKEKKKDFGKRKK